jgi:anaerobic ribonucleoside-triphosphate reductase|tara:strand:+ start:1330 stop:2163 length:834 start_codon:yes stop_codon:yes gene_type:complete
MAATTSTTLDDLFANIIAQARFTAEEESLMMGLVTMYNIGDEAGKTIQVPKYPAITAADLTEGTDMSSTTVSTSSVSISVGEVGAQVVLTDLAAMGAGNPAEELGTVLGNAIATKMDADLIALFDGFSTALGAAAQEITVADLFKAAATLRNNKAQGEIFAVVNPFQAYQLKANLTNTFANPNGGDAQNTAMVNSYVGTIAGIDVYESANVTVDGSGDAKGAVFSREALAIAMKRDFQIEAQRDASLRAFELNATAIYGVGELDDSYGVEMLFDATI